MSVNGITSGSEAYSAYAATSAKSTTATTIDTEKKTNQFIPDVELFFNGIKIADGQIYIADVTPDEISIVFLFGMFSALKRIKDDDRKLYELAYKSGDANMLGYLIAAYAGEGVIHLPVEFGKRTDG